MSEMADASEVDASEVDASEADNECEADPCNSDYDYDYNYDTVDEDDSCIIVKVSDEEREYEEIVLFQEMYNLEQQQSAKRDEFIYTKVFNNHNIGIEILIDFNLGSMEDWSKTCGKFNRGEMTLAFATLFIIIYNSGPYNCVAIKCDNIHPFAEMNKQEDEMARLSSLMHNTTF